MKLSFVKAVSVATATPHPNYTVSADGLLGGIALTPTKASAALGFTLQCKTPPFSAWLRLFTVVSVLAGVAALPA